MKTRDEMIREAYLKKTIPELHRNNVSILNIFRPRPQTGKGSSFMGKQNNKNKKK